MGFKLTPIDVVENISREDFYQNYLKPRRPVVISRDQRTDPQLACPRQMVAGLYERNRRRHRRSLV